MLVQAPILRDYIESQNARFNGHELSIFPPEYKCLTVRSPPKTSARYTDFSEEDYADFYQNTNVTTENKAKLITGIFPSFCGKPSSLDVLSTAPQS